MKKRLMSALVFLAISTLLAGCHLKHEWQEATCTTPKTCSTGGETEGEALGHTWQEATCTTAKTCSVCSETEGKALDHTWLEATYTEPMTCSVCGETEGEPRPQPYVYAHDLPFSKETSFIIQGYRYDGDNTSDYEPIDAKVEIENITVSDSPEEGLQTVTLEYSEAGDIWSDHNGHRKLSIRMSQMSILDLYTGRVVPSYFMQDDAQNESGIELEWEGVPYSINYTTSTRWEQGEWRDDYCEMKVYVTCEITISKGYDGLLLYLYPCADISDLDESAAKADNNSETEVTKDPETYLMDCWQEGGTLIRVSDLLEWNSSEIPQDISQEQDPSQSLSDASQNEQISTTDNASTFSDENTDKVDTVSNKNTDDKPPIFDFVTPSGEYYYIEEDPVLGRVLVYPDGTSQWIEGYTQEGLELLIDSIKYPEKYHLQN